MVMDELIWVLATVNPGLGAAITSQLTSTYTRKRIIVALLKLREGSDDHINAVNKFDFAAALEKRNRAVHDPWSLTEDGEIAQICVSIEKGSLKIGSKLGSIDVLNKTLHEISNKLVEMNNISSTIKHWLSTSPQKWREPFGEFQILHTSPLNPKIES
jgi:hypothetical protein